MKLCEPFITEVGSLHTYFVDISKRGLPTDKHVLLVRSRYSSSIRDRFRLPRDRLRDETRSASKPSRRSLFTGSSQQLDEFFNSSGDEDKNGDDKAIAREKRLKKVDISNPLFTFERQTHQRKSCYAPSSFIKEKWLGLRGMDATGKFVKEDTSKPNLWNNASKSDKLIKK